MDIHYCHDKDKERIFDEKGNQFLSIRYLAWKQEDEAQDSDFRLDMRKWITKADGTEQVNKGFSFLTEQGPHNLARVLLEDNYGHTGECLKTLSTRENFRTELNKVLGKEDPNYDHTIDMDNLYVPGDDLFGYEGE